LRVEKKGLVVTARRGVQKTEQSEVATCGFQKSPGPFGLIIQAKKPKTIEKSKPQNMKDIQMQK